MPARRPDPSRERLRRKRLARWKASGLKVKAFCEREGLTPDTFAHWRKEVRTRDARIGLIRWSAATSRPELSRAARSVSQSL